MRILNYRTMPQDVIPSDKGAYNTKYKLIYIAKYTDSGKRNNRLLTLIHELGHWIIDIFFGGNKHKFHDMYHKIFFFVNKLFW